MITVFNNFANTTKPKYFEIDTVLDSIRNCNVQKQVNAIREEKDEKKKKELKKMLPCILFSGKFTTRADKAITEHSGFVVLDWDKITELEKKKKEISEYPFVYTCFVSPSGDGIKAVVRIPADIKKHRGYYKGLIKLFPELDTTSQNESRICYASCDKDIYINKIATEFTEYIEVLDAKVNNSVVAKEAIHNDYARAQRACKIIRDSIDGEKHIALLKASKLMGGYISGGLIMEDEAVRLLENEIQLKNIDNFDDAKVTIKKGIEYGKSNPIIEETTLVYQVSKEIHQPKVEVETAEFLANQKDIDAYLKLWREDKFQLGLTTGMPSFDEYFVYKRGNFNVVNGFDNVGKSTALWYICLLSEILHGWKWIIYSNENKAGTVVKKMIEFYWGKNIKYLSETQYQQAYKFVMKHNKFISNDFLFTYKHLLKISDTILQEEKFDGMLVDPYNSLSFDYSKLGKISTHEFHYEAASEMQKYTKKNDFCIYLNCHVISSALRLDLPPKKADTEGGGKFSNKADDFMTFHRDLTAPDDGWMEMQIFVRKIKELETGGGYTEKDKPYILKLNKNTCGYSDDKGFDPIANYWSQHGQQLPLLPETKSAITPNNEFNTEHRVGSSKEKSLTK